MRLTDLSLPKILIVEDEFIISEMLRQMLMNMNYDQVTIANTYEDGQAEIAKGQFDLAILDINLLGDHEGIALGAECSKIKKPFFFLTSYTDHATITSARCVKPGAYVLKPFTPEEILVGIEMTMMHQGNTDSDDLGKIAKGLELSDREKEVLVLLAERLTNAEISERLSVSNNTVKYHLKRLYIKLGIVSRADLPERLTVLQKEYS